MDFTELNIQKDETKTETRQIQENLQLQRDTEVEKDLIESLKEKQPEHKQEEINKIKDHASDMSPTAFMNINKVSQNIPLPEKQVKVELPNVRQELQQEDIRRMNFATRTGLIRQIINSPELKGYDGLKNLLDQYLFVLSFGSETEPQRVVNDAGFDVAKSRRILKARLAVQIGGQQDNILMPEEMKNIFHNLGELIQRCFSEDERWNENEIIEDPNPKLQKKRENHKREYEALIDKVNDNPVFDGEDKLVRTIEIYRANQERYNQLADEMTDEVAAELEKIGYAKTIKDMEEELEDFRQKRERFLDRIRTEAAALDEMEEGSVQYEEKKRGLEALRKTYRNTYSSSFKQDIFALDKKEDKTKKYNADKTLDKLQVQTVRRLDKWMLEHATNEYKDKNFMLQVLGCTVRERLAIYMCIEMGSSKPDYAELLFSQTNYLPDEEKIKKAMFGHSFLRKWGAKRVHWSKMRRAYEYVAGRSADIEGLADIAVEEQRKHETDQENYTDTGNLGIERTLNHSSQGIAVDEQLHGEALHANVIEYGNSIVKTLQQIRNGDGDAAELTNTLMQSTRTLRALVDKELSEAKSEGAKKHWARYKTATASLDNLSKDYDFASKIAGALRSNEVFSPDGSISNVVDGADFVAMYGTAAIKLLKCISSTRGMIAGWKTSSKSAKLKSVLDAGYDLNNAIAATTTAITTTTKYGAWAEGFKASRLDAASKMKDRLEKGLSANKFDLQKCGTYFQLVGTGLTVASAAVDYYNIDRSRKASKSIKRMLGNRAKGEKVDSGYRDYVHKKTVANLTNRLNARKGITTTTKVIANGSGYLKYVLPTSYAELTTSGIVVGMVYLAKGVDALLKRRSDYKTVDEFLDMNKMLEEYRTLHPTEDITSSKVRDRVRKNAMLQLGFANTKTFFAHVAARLGDMIHNVLSHASEGGENARTEANHFVTILKSMGLRVNLAKGVIPNAKSIAARLAA